MTVYFVSGEWTENYAKWVLAFYIKYWITIHVFWMDFDFQGLYPPRRARNLF